MACVFCNEQELKEGTILKTNNFMVRVGYSLITPGHVMILPKQHYLYLAEMPAFLQEEYEELKREVYLAVSKAFHEPFLIEYGPGLQTVAHAHIHFIPLQGEGYTISSIVKEMVQSALPFREGSREGMKELRRQGQSYVYVEEHGKTFLFPLDEKDRETKEHFLGYRHFFARVKKLKSIINWQAMTEEERQKDEEKRERTKKELAVLLVK